MHSASFGVDLQSLRSTNLIAISAIVLRCNTSCHVALQHDLHGCRELHLGQSAPPDLQFYGCAIELSEDQGRGPAGRGPAGGPLTLGSGVSPSNSPLIDQLGVPLGGPCGPPDFWGALRSAFFAVLGPPRRSLLGTPKKSKKTGSRPPKSCKSQWGLGGSAH